MDRVKRVTDLILPVGLVTALLIILTPLPAWLIDALLATNIAVSVVILLTTVFVKTPLEFNVFPALLLATTLARLVMNIASTRLILTSADQEGLNAAGLAPAAKLSLFDDLPQFVELQNVRFDLCDRHADA
jgi:flagellar biosynthesis protein FlhA